ncbi:MAG: sulfotransferase family 2 domain-containing protein [Pseudomonadota bacterium]
MRPVLFFIHIPKCAGSSLIKVILRHFKKRAIALQNPELRRSLEEEPNSARDDKYDAVYGHFQFGMHGKFDRPPIFLSCVRDPIDRVCSLFNFIHLCGDHNLHKYLRDQIPDINKMSEEHLKGQKQLEIAMKNHICRALGGQECDAAGFPRFEARVLRQMSDGSLNVGDIGVAKKWLESVWILPAGSDLPEENVTAQMHVQHDFEWASAATLAPATLERLKEWNALDIKLVESIAWKNFIDGRAPRPSS